MKLTTYKPLIEKDISVAGLVTGKLCYEMKGATSNAQWVGGVITPEVWHPILAWFQSVNEATHSECQVRLYYNQPAKKWAAWAYPQEARTGMTAREIDNPTTAVQREQFKASEGWVYCGTVHHHCSSGAFQSGTDRTNEQDQDGLHITIGKLNQDQFDIHARFYLSGNEFSPALSAFWDIGEIKNQLPPDSYEAVARYQMTKPAPAGTVWPRAWTENLIDTTPIYVGFHGGAEINAGGANGVSSNGGGSGSSVVRSGSAPGVNTYVNGMPTIKRRELALLLLRREAAAAALNDDDIAEIMVSICLDPVFALVQRCASQHSVTVEDIAQEWKWDNDLNQHFAGNESAAWEHMAGL